MDNAFWSWRQVDLLCLDGGATKTGGPQGLQMVLELDAAHTVWFSWVCLGDWLIYKVQHAPPCHALAFGMPAGSPMLVDGPSMKVLVRQAHLGFKDVSVPHIHRLLKMMLHPPKAKPAILIETMFCLVSWILPKHTDYYAIVKARVPAKPKTPLTSANCSLPDEVLDSQGKMELKASHKKVEEMELFCFCVVSCQGCV